MSVRHAAATDADAVGALWTASAAAGFRDVLPPGVPLLEFRTDVFREVVGSDEVRILLAEAAEDGAALGYSAFGANRDEEAAPGVAEVRTFFVHPASWRNGVGRRLIGAALDELRTMGYDTVTLWSFRDNPRANAFYEAAGFERDGAERTEEVWGHAPEVRFRRSL